MECNLLVCFSLGWLSTSVNKETLQGKLSGKLEGPKYETERLSRFLSGKSDYYCTSSDETVAELDLGCDA